MAAKSNPAPRAPKSKDNFTPWQRRLRAGMAAKRLSAGDIAVAIATEDYQPKETTVSSWTRFGQPPDGTYTRALNSRLAKLIGTTPTQLWEDFTNSRAQASEQSSARRNDVRVEPFSPWQLRVKDRLDAMEMPLRQLAEEIATKSYAPTHTTLWAWLRRKEGYPPEDVYTPDLNRRLAKTLGIDEQTLAADFDDSRRKLVADRDRQRGGPLEVLRRLIADSKQATWKREELVKLIDDLRSPT